MQVEFPTLTHGGHRMKNENLEALKNVKKALYSMDSSGMDLWHDVAAGLLNALLTGDEKELEKEIEEVKKVAVKHCSDLDWNNQDAKQEALALLNF